eukprot:Tamp_19868.p2 GENE.Tamp_19868~~Tamp_19868.p2  ORF type:complete len:170 (-),score=49.58 Tamp_19868:217-726(-)
MGHMGGRGWAAAAAAGDRTRDDGEGGTEGGGEEQMASVRPAALCEGEEGLREEDYLDMMQQIEEAVMAEILEQEQAQLQEYLEHERAGVEALLDAAVRADGDEVACPVCLKSKLHKHGTTFFCACDKDMTKGAARAQMRTRDWVQIPRVCACTSPPRSSFPISSPLLNA